MNRHQRGRAGCLYIHARSTQVQLVGHPRREEILVTRDEGGETTPGSHELRLRAEIEEVAVQARPRVDPDALAVTLPEVSRPLQRGPGGLQEHPVLGVHDRRLSRVVPKERGIEELYSLERSPSSHVSLVTPYGGGNALRLQLLPGEKADGLHPVAEVSPELIQVPGPGEAAGHPDNGDPFLPLPGLPFFL